MRFAFIDAERAPSRRIPLALYCRVMEVTEGGYWAWKGRGRCHRAEEDHKLGHRIKELFEESGGSYGALRMQLHLSKEGYTVGRRRVTRLMRERGYSAQTPRKWCQTTDSAHSHPIANNVVNRKFTVSGPNKLWLTDISYIATTEGWLYIAAVLDAFSRRVIGYAIADHMETSLCEDALRMALQNRSKEDGLVHHSDRGSQYASRYYQTLLDQNNITCSMSRRANCWDNAMMESFFGRLKNEHIYSLPMRSKLRTKQRTIQWIETWYNHKRVHTSLNQGFSPMEFENHYWQQQLSMKLIYPAA